MKLLRLQGFLGPDKTLLENRVFESLVCPNNPLNDNIQSITEITNEMLEEKA